MYEYMAKLGYRQNLKHESELVLAAHQYSAEQIIAEVFGSSSSSGSGSGRSKQNENPIALLSRDEEFFKMLFDLLDREGQIAKDTWELVKRLQINVNIYNKLVALEDVKLRQDWKELLDEKSPFKLLYSLFIIEHLLEDQEQDD
jgi:hypothetical protein